MAKLFLFCDVEGEPEHDAAIEGLDHGKIELSRVPIVGEVVSIKGAMFEVIKIIHSSIDEADFDAAVELKPHYC